MATDSFPIQLPLTSQEEYQYARNILAYLWKNFGNERLVMWVDETFKPKSHAQNAKTHVWFEQIAEETGHSAAEIKDWAMSEEGAGWFLNETSEVFGKPVTRRRSFADLNKKQTTYLMEQLQAFAAQELSINLE